MRVCKKPSAEKEAEKVELSCHKPPIKKVKAEGAGIAQKQEVVSLGAISLLGTSGCHREES